MGDRFVRLCDWVCVLGTGRGTRYTRLSEAPVVDRLVPRNHWWFSGSDGCRRGDVYLMFIELMGNINNCVM